jgi:predicted phage baseplate assembly protein
MMPLEPPNLDPRTFEDLLREARLRIPRYTSEWTDFNDSDPGMALVQLFAWLTEMLLYQMNQVPDLSYIKFLELIGLELRPAQPATAHLTLEATPGAESASVAAGSPFEASPADGGDPLVFETEAGLDLIRLPLTDVQVYDGSSFDLVTAANDAAGATYRPLGWIPQVGSALYLGFAPTTPPARPRIFPQEMRWRVFLPAAAQAGQAQRCDQQAGQPPTPPVTLVWEYRPEGALDRWRRLNVFEDSSVAFTREGDLLVAGPADPGLTREGKVGEDRYWLRVRMLSGAYPAGRAPEIDFIRPNVVGAVNRTTVRDEVAGTSLGVPDQRFQLGGRPVEPASLQLVVEVDGQDAELWTRVDDLLASGPDDPHYVLNATSGEVRFGNGRRGRIPVASAEIVAREYRYGGGAAGNVAADLINAPAGPAPGLESVRNERAAVGGRDEQPLEELKQEAPARVKSRSRAVTAEDFTALAAQIGEVARATAIPLAHPDHPGVAVPGAVTVVIVPDRKEDRPPKPSADLIRRVCDELGRYRLLTTELFVKGPTYRPVVVRARVAARPYAAFDAVERAVIKALEAYFSPHPAKADAGSGPASQGWEFGQDLSPTNLYSVILGVEDVRQVPSLEVLVDGRPLENLGKPFVLADDELVDGTGAHEITVEPYRDN